MEMQLIRMDVLLLVELTLDINAEKEIESNGTLAKRFVGTVMTLVITNVTTEIYNQAMDVASFA